MYVCLYVSGCMEYWRQLPGISSLLPLPCGFWDSNSGHQACIHGRYGEGFPWNMICSLNKVSKCISHSCVMYFTVSRLKDSALSSTGILLCLCKLRSYRNPLNASIARNNYFSSSLTQLSSSQKYIGCRIVFRMWILELEYVVFNWNLTPMF